MTAAEIAELLAAMREGRLSVEAVAERFRHRSWVAARRPVPGTYADMAAQMDAGADVPGSFDEVVAAYDRGELTREEYRTLARAVADAIDADAGGDGTGAESAGPAG